MMKFNIFNILEKDDKELIHSSFLKYLLENWGEYFYMTLLKMPHSNFKTPELEKSYNKQRFDLEIISNDNKAVIIIENKFKTFPYKKQLDNYDELLNKYHCGKQIYRFLLCFDSDTVSFMAENWIVISYSSLVKKVEEFLITNTKLTNDEKIFIDHYVDFLNEYFNSYSSHIRNIASLLKDASNKTNKFWLRLFYSLIRNKIDQRLSEMGENIEYKVNPGNTSVPLINIIPLKWNTHGIETLIQFQGNEVKFYIHTGNKEVVQMLIDKITLSFDSRNGKIKKLSRREANSYFVYKEKLTDILPDGIDIEKIVAYLIDFFKRIDNALYK